MLRPTWPGSAAFCGVRFPSSVWCTTAALVIVLLVYLVSGFAPLRAGLRPMSLVPEDVLHQMQTSDSSLVRVLGVVAKELSRPAGAVLLLGGLGAFGYIILETIRLEKIPRQRMYVVLVLTFFSVVFWSFYEQSSTWSTPSPIAT